MEQKDIFTLTAEGFEGSDMHRKVTVEVSIDTTTHEFLQVCRTLAIGLGYLEVSWNDALRDYVEEIS